MKTNISNILTLKSIYTQSALFIAVSFLLCVVFLLVLWLLGAISDNCSFAPKRGNNALLGFSVCCK